MVGLLERDDLGRCDVKEEFLGNVMGIENELFNGMMLKSVGGVVVLLECLFDEVVNLFKWMLILIFLIFFFILCIEVCLVIFDVMFDFREVGYDMEIFEYWGG